MNIYLQHSSIHIYHYDCNVRCELYWAKWSHNHTENLDHVSWISIILLVPLVVKISKFFKWTPSFFDFILDM